MRTVMIEAPVAPAAREPCASPVAVPDRDLNEREITTYWSADRTALRECEARRAAAVGAPRQ